MKRSPQGCTAGHTANTPWFFLFFLGINCFAAQLPAVSNPPTVPGTIFQHLYELAPEALAITLETDLKALEENKDEEAYQPAILRYTDDSGQPVTWNIEIRPRGNSRRRVCDLPPLKLEFSDDELSARRLDSDLDDLKLVTQCKGYKVNANYVMQEYMAYRLYNEVTPYSLRVRLLEITFVDTGRKGKESEMSGFVIEEVEELARRHEGKYLDHYDFFRAEELDRPAYLRMAVFQYMIGNTDWAVHNLHNLKLIWVPDRESPIVVPYDFDLSGFVHTDYAIPNERLPINSVTERLYLGPRCTQSEVAAVLKDFRRLVPEFQRHCSSLQQLRKSIRSKMDRYLSGFFEKLNDPAFAEQLIK